VNGILYNHESPRRGKNYVSKKIIAAAVERLRGGKNVLYLGNLDSCRDWGYAPDYVEAMWLMLQQETPDDYIIATGVGHTVRDFVEKAYRKIGIEIAWSGSGINEVGADKVTGEVLVQVDPQFYRPTDVVTTIGDTSKAKKVLGWSAKTDFDGLIDIMISSALKS
jgi:GDPmannose 4,6-dehydratase